MISTTEAEVLGWVARATGLLLGHTHAIPELMSSLGGKCSVCHTDTLCASEHIPVLVCTLFVCMSLPASICNVCLPFYGHVLCHVSVSGCGFPGPKHRACIMISNTLAV